MIYYAPSFRDGEVAQLVEHHVRNVGVESSNLFFSTIRSKVKDLASAVGVSPVIILVREVQFLPVTARITLTAA